MILHMTYRVLNEDDEQLATFPCQVNIATGDVKCAELQGNSELFARLASEQHSVDLDMMDCSVEVNQGTLELKIHQLPMFRTSASVIALMQTGGLKVQADHVLTLIDGTELNLKAVIDLDYGWIGTEAFSNPRVLIEQIEDEYLVIDDIKIDIVRKADYCAQETFEVECEVPFIKNMSLIKSTLSMMLNSNCLPLLMKR